MNVKVSYHNEKLKPYIDAMVRCYWHSCDTVSNLPNIYSTSNCKSTNLYYSVICYISYGTTIHMRASFMKLQYC